ncbi:MAG: hypothetical protein VKM34_03730 [Cyanobacteriota bacterium]|nr:hypothetical protein [Cyanobacteriota bacterium]
MYVSNADRIRLGLQHFGSDIPDDVVAAAEAALARADGAQAEPPAAAPVKRKRARTPSGQLAGDDPSTPDVNEAWDEGGT